MAVAEAKYRASKEYYLVYSELIRAAQYRCTTNYQAVADVLDIHTPGHHMSKETGQVVGALAEDEVQQGRPILSALCVSSVADLPGQEFFGLAE
jgi:hypothetical protein